MKQNNSQHGFGNCQLALGSAYFDWQIDMDFFFLEQYLDLKKIHQLKVNLLAYIISALFLLSYKTAPNCEICFVFFNTLKVMIYMAVLCLEIS
jgi:hypothetical protein